MRNLKFTKIIRLSYIVRLFISYNKVIGGSSIELTERGKEINHELEICKLEMKALKEQFAQAKANYERELKMKDEIIEILKSK